MRPDRSPTVCIPSTPSQKLVPEYAKAATALKAHDPTIVIAKVSAAALVACGWWWWWW